MATTSIPKIVHLGGTWFPEEIVEKNRQLVPHGTEFRYYDYDQLERSAKELGDKLASAGVPGAYMAYRSFRPVSYRVDLWRFMIMWEEGGIYMDAKYQFNESVTDWVDFNADSLFVCQGAALGDLHTGLLASPPKNPVFLEAVREIVANSKSNYYGGSRMEPTGPSVLGKAVRYAASPIRINCVIAPTIDQDEAIDVKLVHLPNIFKTIIIADHSTHAGMRKCDICNDYKVIYSLRAVYCDEEAPPGVYDPCGNTGSYYTGRTLGDESYPYRSVLA